MSLSAYLDALIGRVYKILPMRESELRGKPVHLQEYLASLSVEVKGASFTFPELQKSVEYISILNTLNGLSLQLSQAQVKSEVFKMLSTLDRLREGCGDGN